MSKFANDEAMALIDGHVLIKDIDTQEVLLDKHNAINFINMAVAIANLMGGQTDSGSSFVISEMHFGNGGSLIDETGVIVYSSPNTDTNDGSLHRATAKKTVQNEVITYPNQVYSDVVVTATFDYDEPTELEKIDNGVGETQGTIDNSAGVNNAFTFDEIGLVTESGKFLSHIVFHPIEKSANRKIQVIYTLRIRAGS